MLVIPVKTNFITVLFQLEDNPTMKEIDVDEKLKMIGAGGCWFSIEENKTYSSYEELSNLSHGEYKYICSSDVPITNPEKYLFFNPQTHKGYIVEEGL